jgi:hypothetical protein
MNLRQNVSSRRLILIGLICLWRYRGDDNVIDDEFLRYFRFICDIICYQNGGTTQGKSNDEFDLLKEYFSQANNENVMANIQTFETILTVGAPSGENTGRFFEQFISHGHQVGKIKVEKGMKLIFLKTACVIMRIYQVMVTGCSR